MEPPPKDAFQLETFGTIRAAVIPFHRLTAAYTADGILAAQLNNHIIRIFNTYLGEQRISLRTWCMQKNHSYRRWGKLVNGETWLNTTDITTLLTTHERIRIPILQALQQTKRVTNDSETSFGQINV